MIFKYGLKRSATRLSGEKFVSFDLARGRLVLMSGFFVLAYMMLVVRAFDLAVIRGYDLDQRTQIEEAQNAVAHVPRGNVFDRNGVMIAGTLKMASLYADPYLIADPVAAAQGLVKIFPELSYGDILQKLQSKKRFVWIERNILPEEQARVLEIGEPGLDFRYEDKRIYPQAGSFAHLLGYTNVDNKGQAGIERSFDSLLARGEDLNLTLDVRFQHALHRELEKAVEDFDAKGGFGVIMDVRTGEVLAGVSLPDFNPHDLSNVKPEQLFNRLTLGVYELGSVFKIFSTAALFETLNVPMSTTFDAREPIRRGRFVINDYHAEDRILSVPEVFMYSSNIGSAMMGQAVGTESLQKFYRDLGLLDRLDFEVREVSAPLVPRPWGEVHTLTASYGHGIATTPMQLVSAVSTIMNGGTVVKPTLIKHEASATGGTDLRVVSDETVQNMRQLLRLVVTDGTGEKASVPGYVVGGKTGTAEKPGAKGYDSKRLISSFVGVFPMNDPRYAIFLAVDEPKGNKKSWGYATAGWVAAPAVARVVASMASILGMPPQEEEIVDRSLSMPLKRYMEVRYEP